MRRLSKRSQKRLRKAYTTATLVTGVLLLATLGLVAQAIESAEADGHLINAAGRQRMLSQRVAAQSARMIDAHDEDESRRALDRATVAMDELRETHSELLAVLSPHRDESNESGVAWHHLEALVPTLESLDTTLDALVVAREAGADRTTLVERSRAVSQTAESFLVGMEGAVDACTNAAASHLTSIAYSIRVLALVAILVVAGKFYLVFGPVSRSLRGAFSKAAAHQHDLENVSRELTALHRALDDSLLVSITDTNGRILEVNQGFCRASGYSLDELIGQDHRILGSGTHSREFWLEMWSTIGFGTPWRGEICNRSKDGELYWLDTTIVPQLDGSGQVVSHISVRIDITAQKRAHQRLAELQASLERAVAATEDGLWDHDLGTGELWYSDQFKRLLGVPPEEDHAFAPNIDSFLVRLHPEDYQRTRRLIDEHTKSGEPYDMVYRLRTNGGEYRWFGERGRGTFSTTGEVVRLSGSISDIHENYLVRSRLDIATRSAQVGLWDWELPTGKTFFNDTWYTMLGYEPGEFPMELASWEKLAHPDDVPQTYEDIRRHVEGETSVYYNEHRLRTKDGSWKWIRDVGEVVERDRNGTPVRLIGVHIDIQELRDAIDAANDASRAKGEFLANMSHEIRTPMTAILGYSELIDESVAGGGAKTGINVPDAIRTIRSNGEHLLRIINDVLDMSKIEAGQFEIEHLPTNAVEIVESTMDLVRGRAREKGVELRAEFEGELPTRIVTDPTRLRQILLNLVGNALKFTDEGSVTVRASCDAKNELLHLAVEDTGIGLSPEALERIARFEAFSQADASTTRTHGGTGLGLRISKVLTEKLGGDLVVASVEGQGSTFTATVGTGSLEGVEFRDGASAANAAAGSRTNDSAQVSSSAEAVDPVEAGEPARRPLEGLRILLAEDGPDNQRLIGFVLEKAGATVEVADNGRIAVDRLLGTDSKTPVPIGSPTPRPHFDVVLMDVQMPELDGHAATRELRAAGYRRPIIALTANAMQGDRAACLAAGCTDYLSKPINRRALLDTCARWAGDGDGDDEREGGRENTVVRSTDAPSEAASATGPEVGFEVGPDDDPEIVSEGGSDGAPEDAPNAEPESPPDATDRAA